MADNLDPTDFFFWLDSTYREQIINFVRRNFPSFSHADLDDVWAETRLGLLKKWCSDTGLDVTRGLGQLLRTIAWRRACDLLRIRCRHDDTVDVEGKLEETESRAADIRHREWWCHLPQVEWQELQMLVCEAFGTLAPDEWMVLSVYCEHYPASERRTQLLKCVAEQFPEVSKKGWTAATVARLLERARRRVQFYLKQKGYNFDFRE
jgi:DNA-directed RNA polymerase specialized sigma24 family protein